MYFMFGLPSIDGKYDIQVLRGIINQFPFIIETHAAIDCNLVHNTLIHNARNMMAKNAVEKEADYLFFIDSDMVLPNEALRRLVAYDKDIIAGMYFSKKPPFAPVVFDANEKGSYDCVLDYQPNSLISVDGIGMGICLIKTKVLADMTERYGTGLFNPLPATDTHPVINGEDLAFCQRAKESGYDIFVDTGMQAFHQTVTYIGEEYFKKQMEEIEKNIKEKGEPKK